MSTTSIVSTLEHPHDDAYWASEVATLTVTSVPTGALNLNVEGNQLAGALQGFGQMWQKTYRVRLKGASVTPAEVIKTWKERFTTFWPTGNRFYSPLKGIAPGEVALIKMRIPGDLPIGLPLSTGVMVLYADEESFTFMTPKGHVFAGWITFSAFEEHGCTIAQIEILMRASDFAYEIGFRLGASKAEDAFWQRTISTLAASFDVEDEPVELQIICVDPKVQWSQVWNIWQNAAIRTMLYRILHPALWLPKQAIKHAHSH